MLIFIILTRHFHFNLIILLFTIVLLQTLSIILCQCLSRITLWYCSKLNTILTSKLFWTKSILYFHLLSSEERYNVCVLPTSLLWITNFSLTENSFSTQQMHADRMNYTFAIQTSFYSSKSRLLHNYLV